jgi:nitronate monooxygenase
LQSIWKLKRASLQGVTYRDIFQAGKSVQDIHDIRPAGEIVREFAAALE